MRFEGSSLWKVRQKVGTDLLLWPGSTVLLERADGRVLLGLRGDTGRWAMPGGGAEEDVDQLGERPPHHVRRR